MFLRGRRARNESTIICLEFGFVKENKCDPDALGRAFGYGVCSALHFMFRSLARKRLGELYIESLFLGRVGLIVVLEMIVRILSLGFLI